MGADNNAIGSDWRTTGMRMGLISVMAATGMVLVGQAAEASTTATPSLKAHADGTGQGHTNGAGQGHTNGAGQGQANGAGQGLPLHLSRLAGGNSGASCIIGGPREYDPFQCMDPPIASNGGIVVPSSQCAYEG